MVEPGNATLDEASAALAHGGLAQFETFGYRAVGLAHSAAKNDACPRTQRRWQRSTARKRRELRSLVIRDYQISLRPASSRRGMSVTKIPQSHALFVPVDSGTKH